MMKPILEKVLALGLISASIVACGGEGEPSPPPTTVYKYYTYVSNNWSNNISAFEINTTTGALTEMSGSPFAAENVPISIAADPSGKFIYVADNGLSGSISAFSIDSGTGGLTAVAGSPFAMGGPPSFVTVDPSGKFVYVTETLIPVGPGVVAAFSIDAASGALATVAGSPFAAGSAPISVAVDPSGKFASVANNGSGNTVYVFTVNSATGALAAVAGSPFAAGDHPWSVATIRIKQ
jgi:6-phosphogluconolactonase